MSYSAVQTTLSADESLSSINEDLAQSQLPERILLVDDDTAVRGFFRECLAENYECREASSVQEAITFLAEDEFALVILDIVMPGMSGIELLQKIVEYSPDTAVVMASGINNPQSALEAVRLGAFDYLIKPCEIDMLEMTVKRALEKRRYLIAAEQYKFNLECRNQELAARKAELEELQTQLVHSEKMASLGQLTAGVAHELNNAVSFIFGNLDMLRMYFERLYELMDFYDNGQYYDDTQLPEKLEDEISEIKERIEYDALLANLNTTIGDCYDGAKRISEIVQNLRNFSRLDKPEFAEVSVNEALDSTVALLSHHYIAGNISLVRDYEKLPLISACAGQLNQVWMNLLLNAAQAVETNGNGKVHVKTCLEDKFIVVQVSDNGSGIAPENLDKIFEPFFTTKAIGDGTGLGLSISFGIINHHHGTISVESRLNKGTTFTVRLPISA